MIMLPKFICLLLTLSYAAFAATVKGKLDLGPLNISRREVINSSFKLIQVGNFSGDGYFMRTSVQDMDGNFEFRDVPEPQDANSTTDFVLQSASLDYNLKPNRILVQLSQDPQDPQKSIIRAFKNTFGKENFPSPDILYPEQLPEIEAESAIVISLVNIAPVRLYVTERNVGILKSGPIANILNSKFKLAALITGVLTLLFPYVLEKFDGETVQAMKKESAMMQSRKYSDQKEVTNELQNLNKK